MTFALPDPAIHVHWDLVNVCVIFARVGSELIIISMHEMIRIYKVKSAHNRNWASQKAHQCRHLSPVFVV